jgi:hypothetical protein
MSGHKGITLCVEKLPSLASSYACRVDWCPLYVSEAESRREFFTLSLSLEITSIIYSDESLFTMCSNKEGTTI